jgi:LSD1 subclass zinc finger protein
MISEISKDSGLEDINFCSGCRRLLKLEDRGKTVVIECSAMDRFDCPRLLKIFYPRIYNLPEEERQKLVARIREKKLTKEDAVYLS